MADAEGDPNKFTMRSLAAELGVGVMSLYTYFPTKDAILDGMAAKVLGEMTIPAGADDPATAIRLVAHSILDVMREHPSVGRLLAARLNDNEDAIHGSLELPLRRLVDAGIPGPLAARCYGFVMVFAIGFSSYHLARPWGYSDTDDGSDSAEMRRQREHYYAGRPLARFPTVVELAGDIVDIPGDATFEFGIAALVDAVSREIETHYIEHS
ncbi:TetR family transcriptional regulator [Gordonia desulfuricans]|uniref:TetR family transcriptional regulator n=1 Tax=Gordonia desulfuricans TaxID=89051 RepID=A0A7K3LT85_9ACTN|nr:TetR/AcrR family transcriptional regulator [Gordonia desulfuricans]NDK91504.1 TetR family transcriptional regulator [Gordonia desulfuricans]